MITNYQDSPVQVVLEFAGSTLHREVLLFSYVGLHSGSSLGLPIPSRPIGHRLAFNFEFAGRSSFGLPSRSLFRRSRSIFGWSATGCCIGGR